METNPDYRCMRLLDQLGKVPDTGALIIREGLWGFWGVSGLNVGASKGKQSDRCTLLNKNPRNKLISKLVNDDLQIESWHRILGAIDLK